MDKGYGSWLGAQGELWDTVLDEDLELRERCDAALKLAHLQDPDEELPDKARARLLEIGYITEEED